jgi:hypothetical protein
MLYENLLKCSNLKSIQILTGYRTFPNILLFSDIYIQPIKYTLRHDLLIFFPGNQF